MELWADINMVFHGWPPSEMDQMSLDEVANWWELAQTRSEHFKP